LNRECLRRKGRLERQKIENAGTNMKRTSQLGPGVTTGQPSQLCSGVQPKLDVAAQAWSSGGGRGP